MVATHLETCLIVNKPFVFDLHRDEWRLWSHLGFPRRAWAWGDALPPNCKQIIVSAEWAERFRVWQVLMDWHSYYFDQLWHSYQAKCLETAEPPDPLEQ